MSEVSANERAAFFRSLSRAASLLDWGSAPPQVITLQCLGREGVADTNRSLPSSEATAEMEDLT